MRTAAEQVMGTVVSLAAPDATDPALFRAAAQAAFGYLHHVDEVFSPFRPDSPVSRIRDGRLSPTALGEHPDGPELLEVLALCEELKQGSEGAFDAWAVGDPPGFDPCGAVKGWAAERASALLTEHGLPRHSLNAGGDVRLRAGQEDRSPWRVALADPHRPGKLLTVLEIADGAVATSGTAERGAHVFNPWTHRPARALAQVTVTGPDLARADGWATAALALADGPGGTAGAHAWLSALAERTGCQAVTVDNSGATWLTRGFAALVRSAAAGTPPSGGR
ncbi:thiamine biosynthesis lipoprotein [Kitasatospora sp. MAP12-15]|uniref:FAD:protein FMN transferase n=1 Tax=unclassified Kitasatospora TaxID=2633591 RepID=UPI0024732DA4|nr:FAD:protein FMN transferase [Kitasatospora sp. MAP12-44]MDH6114534.1 thiamine biosynthesis lipoprotein [Kitasatospora sp. MAP12-44]